VKLKTSEGETAEIILARDGERLVFGPSWTCPFDVTAQRYVRHGRHPSGVGYIHIQSFAGDRVADEFETALTELRRTPALIIDIRDNGGGSPWRRIHSRFFAERTLVAVSHDGGRKRYLRPLGPWQYVKPVALLANAGSGSAADIFASYMGAAEQVVTVGATTHGNTGGGLTYVLLPCGLVAWVSAGDGGYDATGRPREGTGQEPDIHVEPTIEDFLAGRDPVIDKAVEVLQARIAQRE
jgi:C-terminal processing protease CtpA/Prc